MRILYPFHKFNNIIRNVTFMGLSDTGKDILLTLMINGELPLNSIAISRIIASTLGKNPPSRASIHKQIKSLSDKELIYVDRSKEVIKLTMKGLTVAGKYVVLVRMIYTVPMTVSLLLLLTILRPWIPWWFLYVATAVAIVHHISYLIVLFMKPVNNSRLRVNGLMRIIPEVLPLTLLLTNAWRRLSSPPRKASVETLDLRTMEVRKRIIKIFLAPAIYLRTLRGG